MASVRKSTFKVPATVTVLGRPYTIKLVSGLKDADSSWGSCDRNTKVIELERSLSEADLKSTLLHEMLHAALAQSGLDEIIGEKAEEAVVRMMEDFLLPLVNFEALRTKRGAQ